MPLCVDTVPWPFLRSPCQTADAVRFIIFLMGCTSLKANTTRTACRRSLGRETSNLLTNGVEVSMHRKGSALQEDNSGSDWRGLVAKLRMIVTTKHVVQGPDRRPKVLSHLAWIRVQHGDPSPFDAGSAVSRYAKALVNRSG
jgi:hypothetical protein